MNHLCGLLLLAAALSQPADGRHPDAVELFHCNFDASWDVDYDRWPDRWTRKRGPQFPHYVAIAIADDDSASANRCVRITLDGAGAVLYSPPIQVESIFSYVLEGRIKTEGLSHDREFLSVSFYDAQGTKLETFNSHAIGPTAGWQTVRLGPISPTHAEARTAKLGLHLQPGQQQDWRGSASFDEIWFARRPRMTLTANRPLNIYQDTKDVEITCHVFGVTQRNPRITFELFDAFDDRLATDTRQLDGQPIQTATHPPTGATSAPTSGVQPRAYSGRIVWKPPLTSVGFYRVRVTMHSDAGTLHRRQMTLAVTRPRQRTGSGEFGWSLPSHGQPLTLDQLVELLPQVGIDWVKFPLWYDDQQANRGDQLLHFAQRLQRDRIRLVGVLDHPPPAVLARFDHADPLPAASIFSADPALWLPSLDPIMTRLSLRIRWWQLGDDRDQSFVGYPDLATKVRAIRGQLFRFGQQAHVGIPWDWLTEPPDGSKLPWDFLTYSTQPALAGSELATYLAGVRPRKAGPWVLIDPLSQRDYNRLATRAKDLVLRMVFAKIGGAEAIFLYNPFQPRRGLMRADGTPGPLLLPWRTTAELLRGTAYLGSVALPGGSHNHVFARDGQAVMVLWNEKPTREVVYLGDQIRQFDLWGRPTEPQWAGGRQVIEVGTLPTFLTGINESIARWRMALSLERTQLPSVFGQPHRNAVQVTNFFPQSVSGDVRLVLSDTFRTYPERMRVKLAQDEQVRLPFEVSLPLGASSGVQPVRVDLNLVADRRYRFSVYRQIQIGLGHVVIQLNTRVDDKGFLVVEQQTTNNSDDAINFRFLLYAPHRRSKRSHVFDLRRGQDLKTYYFHDGKSLIGKTLWLRAEEIDGPRVFNYRVVAEE